MGSTAARAVQKKYYPTSCCRSCRPAVESPVVWKGGNGGWRFFLPPGVAFTLAAVETTPVPLLCFGLLLPAVCIEAFLSQPVNQSVFKKESGYLTFLAKPLRADTPAGQGKNAREGGRLAVSGVAPQASLTRAVGVCWGRGLGAGRFARQPWVQQTQEQP